ncbi:MAG: tRNA lysidine(34) synthetase TilS [Acidimicrobiia bacterium]|nr:tRNA lysidine(34) synthetase TilS [Acidimicrobiia bacterium]
MALAVLATAAGLEPVAVHVDHGLRPGSEGDATAVAAACGRLGIPWEGRRVAVAPGANLEARAREARYGALELARRQLGASAVLVGHTADDQAETVLLNLLRGSGSTGMAGMPVRRGSLVRPLLDLRRGDTREICALMGLAPVDDPMNADSRYRRVWLRRELVPALERGAARDLVPVLARQAEVLREESDYLDEVARAAWGGEAPRAADLTALPPALARRAVRRWLGPPPPSRAEVEAVLAVGRGDRRAVDLAGGRRVRRSGGKLVREPVGRDVPVPFPGRAAGFGLHLESWVERDAPVRWPDGRWTCVVDADRVGPEGRLERAEGRPVLAGAGGEPVWAVGYGIDDRVRVANDTRHYLWITATEDAEDTMAGSSRVSDTGEPTA